MHDESLKLLLPLSHLWLAGSFKTVFVGEIE